MADNYIWNRFVERCSWHLVESLSKSDEIEFVKYFRPLDIATEFVFVVESAICLR